MGERGNSGWVCGITSPCGVTICRERRMGRSFEVLHILSHSDNNNTPHRELLTGEKTLANFGDIPTKILFIVGGNIWKFLSLTDTQVFFPENEYILW
jgi:hypothetical protein